MILCNKELGSLYGSSVEGCKQEGGGGCLLVGRYWFETMASEVYVT
jgi:hypothetical protein